MKTLSDTCLQIEGALKKREEEIKALEEGLVSFEEHASRWPVDQILSRLLALAEAIAKETSRLQAEHSGKGCVWISLRNTGIGIIKWEEDKEVLADREYFKAKGMNVLFPDEMVATIKQLAIELAKGNWVLVVTWLNTHRIYPEKGGRPL